MIRVLLVDEHVAMRNTLRVLLERSGKVAVVGEVRDADHALQAIAQLQPDIVILDAVIALVDSFKLLKALDAMPQKSKVIVISMNDSPTLAKRALQAGASAFVPKDKAHSLLIEAMYSVMQV